MSFLPLRKLLPFGSSASNFFLKNAIQFSSTYSTAAAQVKTPELMREIPRYNNSAIIMDYVPKPAVLKLTPNIPKKLLLGPGPSNVPDDILNSMTAPMLGHLHTEFTQIMDEVKEGIRYAFQTKNKLTFGVSGTGHAGMECAIVNLLEPGERILVANVGLWGERAANMAERAGATVKLLTEKPGTAVDFLSMQEAIASFRPHLVFMCHGESSTGVCQPLQDFGPLCHQHNALFLVDTVASLGAAPFLADQLQVDCVYTSPQKVLNAPPGVSPISFSDRAYEKIKNRKSKVQSFYFDALCLGNYWGCFDEPRKYHHTAPISTVYALRAALARLVTIGLGESIEKHQHNAHLLYELLEEAGFQLYVQNPDLRLPCLTTVCVPEGVNWKAVIEDLMSQGIEISGGLGSTVGKLWRIGTFGMNSNPENMEHVVRALKEAVDAQKVIQ